MRRLNGIFDNYIADNGCIAVNFQTQRAGVGGRRVSALALLTLSTYAYEVEVIHDAIKAFLLFHPLVKKTKQSLNFFQLLTF